MPLRLKAIIVEYNIKSTRFNTGSLRIQQILLNLLSIAAKCIEKDDISLMLSKENRYEEINFRFTILGLVLQYNYVHV